MSNFLVDFYNKAKKKLFDWEQPAEQKISSGLDFAYNKAKNYFKPVTDLTEKYHSPFGYARKEFVPKIQDYFKSPEKVARDVFMNTTPFGAAGKLMNDERSPVYDFFKPTEKVRTRDFVREVPQATWETVKQVPQTAARFAISTVEAPKAIATRQASKKYYNTPFGRLNSFQSEAQSRVERGDPLWKAIGNPALDTVLGAGDVMMAAKPILGAAKNLSKFGKVGEEVSNIAKDVTTPIKLIPDRFQSRTMQTISRPGLTIEDVSKKVVPSARDVAFKSRQAESAAKARQLVAKQLENQRRGLETAEPGFVSPRTVKPPQEPVSGVQERLPLVPGEKQKNTPKEVFPRTTEGRTSIPFRGDEFTQPNGGKPYNAFQRRAYEKKGERIKEIKKITIYPPELKGGGYYKKEIEAMAIPEANAKAELLKLGYPKRVVEQFDLKKAEHLIDNGVKFDKMPEHVFKKFYASRAPRQYSTEEMKNAAGQAQYLSTERGGNIFNDTFDKWIGERNAARTIGMQEGAKYKDIPKEMAWEVIDALEDSNKPVSPGMRAIVGMLRSKMDDIHREATNLGMNVGYLFDYAPHMWKQSDDEVREIIKGAGRKFKFANPRDIPTYREGIVMGLTPKYNNPAQILTEYLQQFEKTKANIRFVKKLMDDGVIVDASVGISNPGFAPITGPGFPKSTSAGIDGEKIIGEYYAPNDVAKTINRIFDTQDNGTFGKVFSGGAKASGVLQDLTLSGGIPKTPINAWTFAQTTKEVLSGRIKSPLVSLFRAASGNRSNQFFEANAGQIKKMQELGIPVDTTWNISNLMDEGFVKNAFTGTESGAWNKTKSAWQKTVNEPTFKRFMPMLQINLFNDIERQATKAGRSVSEAAEIAAKAVRNFYGVTTAGRQARKAQIGKDITGTIFFAPRYRESMINFWANNLKAFRHPLALENRSNLKFLAGATLLYGLYDGANFALTGRHMSENPPGKEDKLLIPIGNGKVIGIPYLSSIATMPRMAYRVGKSLMRGDVSEAARDALQSTVSMGIKPAVDIVANQDYFGNEIYDENGEPTEKFKEQATYLFKQYGLAHPYLKSLASTRTGNELLQKIGLGVEDADFEPKSGFQLASEAIESPLRFYDQNKIASGQFWDEFYRVKPIQEKFRALAKTDRAEAEKYYSENKEAIKSWPMLNDAASMYSEMKEQGIKKQFGGVADDLGFGLLRTPTAEASNGERKELTSGNSPADKILKNFETKRTINDFMESDKKYMELDGKFYFKDPNNEQGWGSTTMEARNKSIVTSKADLEMDRAYDDKNLEAWKDAANKKLQAIDAYLGTLDPEIDQDKIDDLTKTKENLFDKAQQYIEWGGFKKGASTGSIAQKAVSLSTAKLTRLKSRGNFKEWKKEAKTQLDMLYDMANNPNISELQRARAESRIATLEKQYATYKEYDGFKKPAAKKKGKSSSGELAEKWRYPLVDPEMMKIETLVAGTGSRKPIVGKRVLPLIIRRLPKVRRRRRK